MPRPPTFTAAGTYVGDPITLIVRSAAAATGTGPTIECSDYNTYRLNLTGVAFTGGTTPAVTVALETSGGDGVWTALPPSNGSLAAATAGQTKRAVFVGLDRYARITYTTSGAPTNVSFTVAGEAN